MTPHEIVIRFARPFDIRTGNGAFMASISEITVPFADWQSAEAALREVTLSVRAVHDTGGEDYRPVIAGEVVPQAALTRPDALRKSAHDARDAGEITQDGLEDRLRRISFMERQAGDDVR